MALEAFEKLTVESREPTASIASNPWRDFVNLFIISFLVLFFELACIRWFGSMVIFLTFFTNIVLMACFLGMSVGCLAASNERNLIDRVIPLALWTVISAGLILASYSVFSERILVDVGG